jgi:hypothetical protein
MYLELAEHVPADDNVVMKCCHVYVFMGCDVGMVLDLFFF